MTDYLLYKQTGIQKIPVKATINENCIPHETDVFKNINPYIEYRYLGVDEEVISLDVKINTNYDEIDENIKAGFVPLSQVAMDEVNEIILESIMEHQFHIETNPENVIPCTLCIDFGNTNSMVILSYIEDNQRRLLPLKLKGDIPFFPSNCMLVMKDDKLSVKFGWEISELIHINPTIADSDECCLSPKRLIFSDEPVTCKVVDLSNNKEHEIRIKKCDFARLLIREIIETAHNHFNKFDEINKYYKIDKVLLSHPLSFSLPEKERVYNFVDQAVKEFIKSRPNYEIPIKINFEYDESTSAQYLYNDYLKNLRGYSTIFDIGGGTTDIAIFCRFKQDRVEYIKNLGFGALVFGGYNINQDFALYISNLFTTRVPSLKTIVNKNSKDEKGERKLVIDACKRRFTNLAEQTMLTLNDANIDGIIKKTYELEHILLNKDKETDTQKIRSENIFIEKFQNQNNPFEILRSKIKELLDLVEKQINNGEQNLIEMQKKRDLLNKLYNKLIIKIDLKGLCKGIYRNIHYDVLNKLLKEKNPSNKIYFDNFGNLFEKMPSDNQQTRSIEDMYIKLEDYTAQYGLLWNNNITDLGNFPRDENKQWKTTVQYNSRDQQWEYNSRPHTNEKWERMLNNDDFPENIWRFICYVEDIVNQYLSSGIGLMMRHLVFTGLTSRIVWLRMLFHAREVQSNIINICEHKSTKEMYSMIKNYPDKAAVAAGLAITEKDDAPIKTSNNRKTETLSSYPNIGSLFSQEENLNVCRPLDANNIWLCGQVTLEKQRILNEFAIQSRSCSKGIKRFVDFITEVFLGKFASKSHLYSWHRKKGYLVYWNPQENKKHLEICWPSRYVNYPQNKMNLEENYLNNDIKETLIKLGIIAETDNCVTQEQRNSIQNKAEIICLFASAFCDWKPEDCKQIFHQIREVTRPNVNEAVWKIEFNENGEDDFSKILSKYEINANIQDEERFFGYTKILADLIEADYWPIYKSVIRDNKISVWQSLNLANSKWNAPATLLGYLKPKREKEGIQGHFYLVSPIPGVVVVYKIEKDSGETIYAYEDRYIVFDAQSYL